MLYQKELCGKRQVPSPAFCVILGKSLLLPWSGFLHLQNGYSNLSRSAPHPWCEGHTRKCEKLVARRPRVSVPKRGGSSG